MKMQTLPNGITVFNATPHVIRFWDPDWDKPVEVAPDASVSAKPQEEPVVHGAELRGLNTARRNKGISFVRVQFVGTDEGRDIVRRAYKEGADLVVGSIIAAQAYEDVVAMTPAPGYERVPPTEKRMNPDKFTVY
jgi:hypothetical protein